MSHFLKKALSLLMALCLLTSMVSGMFITAYAEEEAEAGNYTDETLSENEVSPLLQEEENFETAEEIDDADTSTDSTSEETISSAEEAVDKIEASGADTIVPTEEITPVTDTAREEVPPVTEAADEEIPPAVEPDDEETPDATEVLTEETEPQEEEDEDDNFSDLVLLTEEEQAEYLLNAGSTRVPTQAEAYSAMIYFKTHGYPEGLHYTNDDYYGWKGGIYSGGYGCAGFAFMLSDAAFGDLPARMITSVNISKVHVGDILRVNNDTHSVIVMEVYSDHVVLAEANYNSSVHWGRTMTASEVAASTHMLTRYPEGHFGEAFKITYNANGGENAPGIQWKEKGEPFRLTMDQPDREFYDFLGWSTSPTATSPSYTSGSTYNKDADLTLYAVWRLKSMPAIGNTFPKSYTVSVPGNYEAAYYKFTPALSGNYTFESTGSADPYIKLYSVNGTLITEDDDSGTDFNFKLDATLTANATYILVIKTYGGSSAAFTMNASSTAVLLSAPVLGNPVIEGNGITVKWNAVSGAAKYRVFYKTGSTGWQTAGTTSATSYTVTGLTQGTAYTFTVRCLSADGTAYTSNYNTTGKTIVYKTLPAPVLSSVENTANGVKVSWSAVGGAAKYRVFCKTSGTSWVSKGDTTGTSFTVDGLTNGTVYSFTVRCISSDGKSFTSSYDTVGKSITYKFINLPTPVMVSVSNIGSGVSVKWNAVAGAAKYRVYYKTASGSWKAAGDTTGTNYTVTGLANGTAYSFTVRCTSADGKSYTSSYDTKGLSITYSAFPVLTSVANAASGVTVKWNAVAGAAKYRVFYKTPGGSWVRGGDTTDTTYTVTGLSSGNNYAFTVRCMTSDGASYTSGFDSVGKSITYVAAPVISAITPTKDGVTIRWNSVNGAAKYCVYYKNSSGSWERILDTASNSCDLIGLSSGFNYTFTIRCLSADGKTFTSSFYTAGKSIFYIAAPQLTSAYTVPTGITVSWSTSNGAAKYRVFYKTENTSWKAAGDTTASSYTVTGLTRGTKYIFTVRCVSSDGKTYTSAFDTDGISGTYLGNTLATPKLRLSYNADSNPVVSWDPVPGAVCYRMYYKLEGETTWNIAIESMTGTEVYFNDYHGSDAVGPFYETVTVRCISADGKTFTSGYDPTGVTFAYHVAPY